MDFKRARDLRKAPTNNPPLQLRTFSGVFKIRKSMLMKNLSLYFYKINQAGGYPENAKQPYDKQSKKSS